MQKRFINKYLLGLLFVICQNSYEMQDSNSTKNQIESTFNEAKQSINPALVVKKIVEHPEWTGATKSRFFEIRTQQNQDFVAKYMSDAEAAEKEIKGSELVRSQWIKKTGNKND